MQSNILSHTSYITAKPCHDMSLLECCQFTSRTVIQTQFPGHTSCTPPIIQAVRALKEARIIRMARHESRNWFESGSDKATANSSLRLCDVRLASAMTRQPRYYQLGHERPKFTVSGVCTYSCELRHIGHSQIRHLRTMWMCCTCLPAHKILTLSLVVSKFWTGSRSYQVP